MFHLIKFLWNNLFQALKIFLLNAASFCRTLEFFWTLVRYNWAFKIFFRPRKKSSNPKKLSTNLSKMADFFSFSFGHNLLKHFSSWYFYRPETKFWTLLKNFFEFKKIMSRKKASGANFRRSSDCLQASQKKFCKPEKFFSSRW